MNPAVGVLALAVVALAVYAWRLRKRVAIPTPDGVQVAALQAKLATYDEATKVLAARITYERDVRIAVGFKA